MDDFNDYDEMNDIDDPLDGDSDNDNFENIDSDTFPLFEDSSPEFDEPTIENSEIHEPTLEVGFDDLNTITEYDDLFLEHENSLENSDGYAEMYGNPSSDAIHWHQQKYPDTCAIVSQEYILEAYIDRDFSEEELALEAMSKGYYAPGVGTLPEDVGNLLEDHGIEVERSDGNSIENITDKLSKHQKVIVGVDANEIWAPSDEEQLKDLLFMPEANHAVMVTGYDDSTQTVYLNDPGHPDGAKMSVNLDDFENAWNDSCNFMVCTVKAPTNISA